jgi:hypothetical protein
LFNIDHLHLADSTGGDGDAKAILRWVGLDLDAARLPGGPTNFDACRPHYPLVRSLMPMAGACGGAEGKSMKLSSSGAVTCPAYRCGIYGCRH